MDLRGSTSKGRKGQERGKAGGGKGRGEGKREERGKEGRRGKEGGESGPPKDLVK